MDKDIDRESLQNLALENEAIKRYTSEGEVRKVIVVPGKLVNVVVV